MKLSRATGLARQPRNEPILCVEVGHTRFKAAILPQYPTFEELQKTKTYSGLSHPWLKGNLEQLFKPSKENPLNELLSTRISEISLSIFGPIYDHKIHGCGTQETVSANLHETLQKDISAKLRIESDSVSWATGAVEFLKLTSHSIQYPALALTFGTGPGVALIENPETIHAIEIWVMSPAYSRLKPLAKPHGQESRPYRLFQTKFLSQISGGESNVNEKMKTYGGEFNAQVKAFSEDVREYVQTLFPSLPKIETFLIGGGVSRFIDSNSPSSIVLNPQFLEKQGVSPDIIQLLGCERMCEEAPLITNTHPSLSELQEELEKRRLVRLATLP